MGVVQLPVGRLGRNMPERGALRNGVAASRITLPLRLVHTDPQAYCAGCAAPIEFGAVMRGALVYCSIECSLGGDRPA
jgi:hypothetical protein